MSPSQEMGRSRGEADLASIGRRRRFSRHVLLLLVLSAVWTARVDVGLRAYANSFADDGAAHQVASSTASGIKNNHGDFFVGVDRALGEGVPKLEEDDLSAPPPEDTWLLSPSPRGNTTNRIPRVINKIYFQKNGHFHHGELLDRFTGGRNVTSKLREAHETWTTLNPGYDVHYYDLASARGYLEAHFHPVFLRTFDCIQAFAGKSDFFRVALLYREGGFHSDWKQVCLEPNLLDQIANETDWFAALDIGNGLTQKSRSCVANAFIGSTPGHPIAAKYLELVMTVVQSGHYPVDALFVTGPCLLGIAVMHVNKDFGEDPGDDNTTTPVYENFHLWPEGGRRTVVGYYAWKGRRVILNKCNDCGSGQDWSNGNNYNKLYETKTYFCEDSASILQPTFRE